MLIDNLLRLSSFLESIVLQGMLHSRGELLLMLDADGATKVTDLEKLENQVNGILQWQFSQIFQSNLRTIFWCQMLICIV